MKAKYISLIATIVLSTLIGCTDNEASSKALENSGYTDIQLKGYAWVGCSESDDYATRFTAKNVQGKQVSGVVCCGWMKSCTVRF